MQIIENHSLFLTPQENLFFKLHVNNVDKHYHMYMTMNFLFLISWNHREFSSIKHYIQRKKKSCEVNFRFRTAFVNINIDIFKQGQWRRFITSSKISFVFLFHYFGCLFPTSTCFLCSSFSKPVLIFKKMIVSNGRNRWLFSLKT